MNLLLTLVIGFSVVATVVLFTTYALFLHNINHSPRALVTGALLLASLAFLQLGHLEFIRSDTDPLSSLSYRFWLFLSPSMFYFFARSILFDETRFSPSMLLHLAPVALIYVARIEVSMSILFCLGVGYSVWLTQVVYRLRGMRQRSRFELFFLALFTLMAIIVLLLGFALPYMEPGYFYTFYTLAVGVALILVVAVLLSFPELLADLAAAAKASYAASTLKEVDVPAKKHQLHSLMEQEKVYLQEDLNLTSLADAMELSPHQLSELINTQYQVSFSRYVRERRVHQAQRLLREQPHASILAISLEVGFKSQSNFYAAFKEITGQSPGAYRAL